MEASTLASPAGAVERNSDAAKNPAKLFRWSEYIHIGQGAEECPHGVDGACEDQDHFHAFCRLPNQFQHSDIRQRAQAAKARTIRRLRDPESDANAVLEGDMAELERVAVWDSLVDELVNRDFWKDHVAAQRELEEDERWEHIDRDRDRLIQLDEMDPLTRDNDEREELLRHIAAYTDALDARRKELQAPRRSALSSLDVSELIGQIREDRITSESNASFMETYSMWEWYSCTLAPSGNGRPSKRVFETIEDLQAADRDVLDAISATFTDLEAAFQRGPSGNS